MKTWIRYRTLSVHLWSKMSHNCWTIYRNSGHSDAIVRRFFWRSVSTRGLFNIELRLRPRQSRPLVCRPLFLFSRPQRLLRPLAEPVGRSRRVQQTLSPPSPRRVPSPAVSAAAAATAPPARPQYWKLHCRRSLWPPLISRVFRSSGIVFHSTPSFQLLRTWNKIANYLVIF